MHKGCDEINNNLKIRIYDKNFTWLSEVQLVNSLQFTRELYDVGKFEIHLPIDMKNSLQLTKRDNIIVINNDPNKSGIVRDFYISETRDGAELVVYGETGNALTKQRITVPPTKQQDPQALGWDKINSSAESVLKHYVSRNLVNAYDSKRNIGNLIIAEDKWRGRSVPWKSRYTDLSLELFDICNYADIGYKIYTDVKNKNWIFDVIDGVDRTKNQDITSPVVFKMEYQNVEGYKYIEDYSKYKSTGYAGGQGEDENRLIYTLGSEFTGIERWETFLECGSADNIDELIHYGEQKMVENTETTTIEAGALPKVFIFEKDYFLGDKVTILITRLETELDTRITSVKEIWERNRGYAQEIRFGGKVPNIFDITNDRSKKEVK